MGLRATAARRHLVKRFSRLSGTAFRSVPSFLLLVWPIHPASSRRRRRVFIPRCFARHHRRVGDSSLAGPEPSCEVGHDIFSCRFALDGIWFVTMTMPDDALRTAVCRISASTSSLLHVRKIAAQSPTLT